MLWGVIRLRRQDASFKEPHLAPVGTLVTVLRAVRANLSVQNCTPWTTACLGHWGVPARNFAFLGSTSGSVHLALASHSHQHNSPAVLMRVTCQGKMGRCRIFLEVYLRGRNWAEQRTCRCFAFPVSGFRRQCRVKI